MLFLRDIYTFPAVFNYAQDGISISFPDLPGCLSCADTNEEAVYMATDALGLRLYSDECDGIDIPEPSDPLKLQENLEANQLVTLIRVYMPLIRDMHNKEKSANKMCTIPQWLLIAGKNADINFSQTLQDALLQKLGIEHEIKRRNYKSKVG